MIPDYDPRIVEFVERAGMAAERVEVYEWADRVRKESPLTRWRVGTRDMDQTYRTFVQDGARTTYLYDLPRAARFRGWDGVGWIVEAMAARGYRFSLGDDGPGIGKFAAFGREPHENAMRFGETIYDSVVDAALDLARTWNGETDA